MRWENADALNELLAEAEILDDGYLTVARVLPGRREEQLASRDVGPASEALAAVERATTHLAEGTRVRVRLWRRGGHPVRGVVVTTASPRACPGCADLAAGLDRRDARIEEVLRERDELEDLVADLQGKLADVEERAAKLRRNLKDKKHQLRAAFHLAAEWQERAEQGEALAAMVNALELP